ncbi:transmembrane protein 179-like [Panonychus citri]|uniref:transmembrane protein 179-like n=1 Tax=Panonychus citri TaxID=50023 RepID=UPI0023079684|nr:transmembrane protein 179-like [Panonychus citri]
MAIGNVLLLTQIAGYLVSFILSFCVLIPLIVNMKNFKGNCLLYTSRFLDTEISPTWASCGYCTYTAILSAAIVLVSLAQLIRMSHFLRKGVDSSFISAFWDTVIAFVFVGLTILDAIFVTSGFSRWCSSVSQRFSSCEAGQGILHITQDNQEINTTNFFIQMGTVQFGIWTLFVSWVLLLVLAGRKLSIYHERENLIISMSRDRQRYASQGYNNLDI